MMESKQTTCKIAFIVEHCPLKGVYPFERAIVLYELLQQEQRFVFLKTEESHVLSLFTEANITPILFETYEQLAAMIRQLNIDLIIQDGKDTLAEQVELLRPFCRTIVQFDNFSTGHMLTDYNIYSIFHEALDTQPPNSLIGSYSFAVPKMLQHITSSAEQGQHTLPHIVIYFENGDEHNLTFRTLRHLTQLHIPLQITVIVDPCYKHAIDELQLMALSRKHTTITKNIETFYSLLTTCNILIGNAGYTPYKAAAVGVPYIALAQHELEVANSFPREFNGFIHLGIGKKMKQSALQNAVMELLLHEDRKNRAIRKQQALEIPYNNEILQSLLTDIAHGQHHVTSS